LAFDESTEIFPRGASGQDFFLNVFQIRFQDCHGLVAYRFYRQRATQLCEYFFQFLKKIKIDIEQIRNKILTYDNYKYEGTKKTVVSFIFMVITGLLLPFVFLYNSNLLLLFSEEYLRLLSSLGFGLSTFLAIFLIYRDISKF